MKNDITRAMSALSQAQSQLSASAPPPPRQAKIAIFDAFGTLRGDMLLEDVEGWGFEVADILARDKDVEKYVLAHGTAACDALAKLLENTFLDVVADDESARETAQMRRSIGEAAKAMSRSLADILGIEG